MTNKTIDILLRYWYQYNHWYTITIDNQYNQYIHYVGYNGHEITNVIPIHDIDIPH